MGATIYAAKISKSTSTLSQSQPGEPIHSLGTVDEYDSSTRPGFAFEFRGDLDAELKSAFEPEIVEDERLTMAGVDPVQRRIRRDSHLALGCGFAFALFVVAALIVYVLVST